jgi:hypothetical protein
MRRTFVLPALLVAALALAAAGLADDGKKQPHPNKATTTIRTTDNGCAGNTWADDTLRRTVKVHAENEGDDDNNNAAAGSMRVRIEDKGTFVTNAGGTTASPGNCPENRSRHGKSVRPGVTGSVKGFIEGTVTGGTFNPNATCTAVPCTKAVFIAAFFGPTAKFSCLTTSSDCKFKYDYHAKRSQQLLFRHWQDRGKGAGTLLKERFKGDIADR